MDKKSVIIGLEFIYGPLQKLKEDEKGNDITGIDIVDKDEITQKLDFEIGEIWCSLYSEDIEEPSGWRFDSKKEKEIAPHILELINKLINRLNEINDGTYEIKDMISDHLKSLND